MKNDDNRIVVSTVVPLYKGAKYIPHLIELCRNAYIKANLLDKAELIFVNDFPDQKIDKPEEEYVRIITNEINCGIHRSRSIGIRAARGEWIHLLDQDDSIMDSFYLNQLGFANNADVIVSNAIIKDGGYDRLLYRNVLERTLVKHGVFYVQLDNRIISPGQCLIKKKIIPDEWLDNHMVVNGADDLLLWLLLFDRNYRFALNPNPLYTHEFTGENLSSDTENMTKSMNELLDFYIKFSKSKKYEKKLNKKIGFLNGNIDSVEGRIHELLLRLRKAIIKMSEKNN